jgi:long-chain acyl-CoA synthetase
MVLPMHHAFPFTMSMVVAPYIGGEVTFENDLRRIRDRMAEVKPTIFLGVPQLFEVMWRNILHGIEVQGKMDTFNKGMRIQEATKKRTGVNLGRIIFRELHARLGGSLRFAVSGGAALNAETQSNFAKIGLPIIQGWGMTEAAPVLSAQRWNPRKFYTTNHYEEQVGSVGQALDGVEIALIDVPEKELYVHLHGEGELVARGDNIMPGYWQGEEVTAAAKVGEWLRTGDVGRIDEQGNIWITGRSKFVIVLDSGEKIHPDEVEERLELSPVIEDVAIVGKKVRGKVQPWAIIYPNLDEATERLGASPSEADVRALVQAEMEAREHDIAQYKRPVDFVLTDTPLPRTKPLRKLARGQIVDEYSFDAKRWAQTWPQHLDAIATPGAADPDEDLDAVVAAEM